MRWCLHTALYDSLPPTSSNSFVSTIRFVNGPGVPSLHLMHNADNLVTLSATGIQSKISPNFSCLKSASRPASMTVFFRNRHICTKPFRFSKKLRFIHGDDIRLTEILIQQRIRDFVHFQAFEIDAIVAVYDFFSDRVSFDEVITDIRLPRTLYLFRRRMSSDVLPENMLPMIISRLILYDFSLFCLTKSKCRAP